MYAVSADTAPVAFRVTGFEQGHTPANRGVEQTYTRTVLLAPTQAQTAGTALGLHTVARAMMDKDAIKRELKLADTSIILLNHPIGFGK